MRHLAIGDIHGCFKALATLATFVPFRPDDVIITLGDYVNRGPNSKAVIEWLIARMRAGNLAPLRGNHEIMMLQARESAEALHEFLRCGGDATLASYASDGGTGRLEDVPGDHWRFLENTRPYFETDTHFFVHGSAYADCFLADQPDYMLYWESFEDSTPHESGKIMVCGHKAQRSGKPKDIGHALCIDTWAHGGGWLTCVDVELGQYWQANQHGDTRWSWLELLDDDEL